jgi:two-component system response regulator
VADHLVEILLVEDNPNDAELSLYALRKHRIANRIHLTKDGSEAIEYLFGEGAYEGRNVLETPKVILLDLKLPKVDGLEVLKRIKSDPRTHQIPVVVLTSSREDRDIIESYKLGVNSYIVKPIDFEQFSESVRQLGFYWVLLNESPVSKPEE